MSTEAEIDAFFDPAKLDDSNEPPRDHLGRYVLPSIDGTIANGSWSRATTVAKAVEDREGLNKWKDRTAAKGFGMRPDLAALAAVSTGKAADAVVEQARSAGGGDVGRNHGTATHAAIVQAVADGGRLDNVAPQFHSDVRAALAELQRHGIALDPHWCERVVLNEKREIAGTLDYLAKIAGSDVWVVLDVKTGSLSYGAGGFAIQQAIYAECEYARDFTTNTWEKLPPIRSDFALILHVPHGQGRAELFTIDLATGRAGLDLALAVRAFGKAKPLAPYAPGVIPAAQLGTSHHPAPAPLTPNDAAVVADFAALLAGSAPAASGQRGGFTLDPLAGGTPVAAGPVFLPAADGNGFTADPAQQARPVTPAEAVANLNAHAAANTAGVPSSPTQAELDEIEELTKMTKEALAAEAAKYGITDVKRYKIKIAREIVAARRAGLGAPSSAVPTDPAKLAEQIGTPAPTAEPERPPIPEHPVFVQPEPVANPYAAPGGPVAPPAPMYADQWLAEIAAATSRQELANVWQRCTSSGAVWTAEHAAAGEARLSQLAG